MFIVIDKPLFILFRGFDIKSEKFRTAWSVGNIQGNSEIGDIISVIFVKTRSKILPAELEITSLIYVWPNSDIVFLNKLPPPEPKADIL